MDVVARRDPHVWTRAVDDHLVELSEGAYVQVPLQVASHLVVAVPETRGVLRGTAEQQQAGGLDRGAGDDDMAGADCALLSCLYVEYSRTGYPSRRVRHDV